MEGTSGVIEVSWKVNDIDRSSEVATHLKYTSNHSEIASGTNGTNIISYNEEGNAEITVMFNDEAIGKIFVTVTKAPTGGLNATVKDANASPRKYIISLIIADQEISIYNYNVNVSPADYAQIYDTWDGDLNRNIKQLSIQANGSYTVTATYNGKTYTTSVTVSGLDPIAYYNTPIPKQVTIGSEQVTAYYWPNVFPDNVDAIKEKEISDTVSEFAKGAYFIYQGHIYQRTGDTVKWGNIIWNSLSDMCSWGSFKKVT